MVTADPEFKYYYYSKRLSYSTKDLWWHILQDWREVWDVQPLVGAASILNMCAITIATIALTH